VNPVGAVDNDRTAAATRRMRGLLKSIPPTLVCPTLVGSRQIFQGFVGHEASVQATNRVQESFQDVVQAGDDFPKA
jgi:hypothetical protein